LAVKDNKPQQQTSSFTMPLWLLELRKGNKMRDQSGGSSNEIGSNFK